MRLNDGSEFYYDQDIISNDREWEAQFRYLYNGVWYSGFVSELKSFNLTDSVISGNNIEMGCVASGKLTVNLVGITSLSLLSRFASGTRIGITLTLANAELSTQIKSQTFVVDDLKKTKTREGFYNATVTAYDLSYTMTKTYTTSLVNPTAKEIVSEIANKYGLTVDSSVDNAITAIDGEAWRTFTPLADFTDKQTLGYMAGCYGCYAKIDERDRICFEWYKVAETLPVITSNLVYDGSSISSDTTTRTIVMLESGTQEEPIVVPNNALGHSINFENPYISTAQAEAIYNNKIADGKISFQVGKIKYKGNPLHNPGTIVEFADISYAPFYIMKRTINYDGGLSETIECLGESETTINYKITSPTQQKINRALSRMEEAIKKATDVITQTKGSVFEFIPIDESDPTKGNSGWKLYSTQIGSNNLILANSSGIGFSSNGGQSFNAMALYIDENGIGHINANCIDVGKLSASVIDTSALIVGGGNYDDLESLLNGVVDTANNSVTKVDVLYGKNQSTTTPPTNWSTDAPVWENGWYIWTKTQTTAGGVTSETQPVCITGAKGQTGSTGATGATGADGEDGQSVKDIEEQYYLSTSSTTQTGGSWSTAQPAWSSGRYIWTRSKITWENPTATTYTTPILAKAINGANSTANTANNTANSAQTTANTANTADSADSADPAGSG